MEPLALTPDQRRDSDIVRRRDPPNSLSALSITVHPDRRQTGLAEALIAKMKQMALEENLHVLVVPLRPTRKSEYPHVDMRAYIDWPVRSDCLSKTAGPVKSISTKDGSMPFDPWLRKHLRLSGKIVKVAQSSMTVHGTDDQWSQWTKINFRDVAHLTPSCVERDYVDILILSGLVPVRYYQQEKIGI